MATAVPLTGLASNDPVPGNYLEMVFAAGPAPLGGGNYDAILIGNKTSQGLASCDTVIYGPDTATSLNSVADANTLFGSKSELARMYRAFLKRNNSTSIYAIAVSEGAGAAATGTITLATTATAAGVLRVWLGPNFVEVAIANGDTPSVVAAAAIDAINAKTEWPAIATNLAGVITLTAANKGPRGNWHVYSAEIVGSGIGMTATPIATTYFTGGTVNDDNTAVLGTLLSEYHYYIISAANDATQLGDLAAQVDLQAAPITGVRQRVFAGSVDTLANTITLTTGINAARDEILWQEKSDIHPAELAAIYGAVVSLFEAGLPPSMNFSGFGKDAQTSTYWLIKRPRSGTNPTRAMVKAALNNGITPIGISKSGTYMVKRVTMRSLMGSSSDYRIRDAHKVTVCDRFADDLLSTLTLQYGRKLIGDDPLPGAKQPPPTVVTPSNMRSAVISKIRAFEGLAMVQRGDEIVAGLLVDRDPANANRMNIRIALQTIDILDQIATELDQVQ